MKSCVTKIFGTYVIVWVLAGSLFGAGFVLAQESPDPIRRSVLNSPNESQLEHRTQFLTTINNLFGINTSKYEINLKIHTTTTMPNEQNIRENLCYELTTDDNNYITTVCELAQDTSYTCCRILGRVRFIFQRVGLSQPPIRQPLFLIVIRPRAELHILSRCSQLRSITL